MKLTIRGQSGTTNIQEVKSFEEVNEKIKIAMNTLRSKKATFTLTGDAELKEVVELNWL